MEGDIRPRSGRSERIRVRSYQVYRPTDDPNFVAVDLEFDSLGEAEAFKVALQELWRSPQAMSP